MYDQPTSVTISERIQVVMVFAILAYQTGLRNHRHAAEKMEASHHWVHYALSHYRHLFHDKTLASLQAMALIMVHFRNLPKPGFTWNFTNRVLVRAIELDYHRDPDKIELPAEQQNLLSKELRKRVFHSLLGICITIGCRVGKPAPWHFQHIDVPLPMAIKDSEISTAGVSTSLSGQCDLWGCIHLSKLLPLLAELHNNIISVRRSAPEYTRTVEILDAKIIAWRQDWETSIQHEVKHVNLSVASLLIETWGAEYQLYLHHPVCCTAPEMLEKNLETCHKAARRLLQAFHTLSSRYKGVDFTWHSTVAYAAGFGITLHVYRQRKSVVVQEQFDQMRNELKGWMSLMAYADLVLRKFVWHSTRFI